MQQCFIDCLDILLNSSASFRYQWHTVGDKRQLLQKTK